MSQILLSNYEQLWSKSEREYLLFWLGFRSDKDLDFLI